MPEGRGRRRRVAVVAALLVMLLVSAAIAVAVLGRGTGSARVAPHFGRARSMPDRSGAPLVPSGLHWWIPVRGEPTGVSTDTAGAIVLAWEEVRAIDPVNGSRQWRVEVPGVGGRGPARAASDASDVAVATTGGVVALDRVTGARRWSQPFVGRGEASDPGTVALATVANGDRLVLATTGDSSAPTAAVAAFDAATGTPRWSVEIDGEIVVAPRIDAARSQAVVSWRIDGGAGHVRAIDLATGVTRWEDTTEEWSAAPTVAGSLVLIAEGDDHYQARVRALDAATGAGAWSTPMPSSFEARIEPAADGGEYAVVDHFGNVALLDAATGVVHWRSNLDRVVLDGRVLLTPTAVIVHDAEDFLVVLDRSTGRVRSITRQHGSLVDATVVGNRLLVALRLARPSRVEGRRLP